MCLLLDVTQLSKYAPSLVSNRRDEMNRFVTGVSDDLKEECHLAMLHENMNISHIMVHAKHLEEQGLGERIEMLRGQDLLMEVLQRISLRYKTRLGLRSGFLIKYLPSFPRLGMIGCLTITLRREGILVHPTRSLHVPSVEKGT